MRLLASSAHQKLCVMHHAAVAATAWPTIPVGLACHLQWQSQFEIVSVDPAKQPGEQALAEEQQQGLAEEQQEQ